MTLPLIIVRLCLPDSGRMPACTAPCLGLFTGQAATRCHSAACDDPLHAITTFVGIQNHAD